MVGFHAAEELFWIRNARSVTPLTNETEVRVMQPQAMSQYKARPPQHAKTIRRPMSKPPYSSIATFIAVFGPHARTRAGRECRPHELDWGVAGQHTTNTHTPLSGRPSMGIRFCIVPGPLTFRIMDRVWSSMNSTRTWVTPPREPKQRSGPIVLSLGVCFCVFIRHRIIVGTHRFGRGLG